MTAPEQPTPEALAFVDLFQLTRGLLPEYKAAERIVLAREIDRFTAQRAAEAVEACVKEVSTWVADTGGHDTGLLKAMLRLCIAKPQSAATPPPGDAGNPTPVRRPFETGPGGLWKDERGIWREPGEGIRGGGA